MVAIYSENTRNTKLHRCRLLTCNGGWSIHTLALLVEPAERIRLKKRVGNLRLWLTLASRGGLIVDGLRLCLIQVHPEYRQLSLVAVRASYLINRRDSAAQASPPPPRCARW